MNCPCLKFDLLKYRGKPYLLTPCATCALTKETNRTNKHTELFDTDGAVDLLLLVVGEQPSDLLLVPSDIPQETINIIMEACLQNLLVTLSNTVLKLTELSKSYPVLFLIITLKMQYPELSYYDIGEKLDPPCSKQNVLYHLQHAVTQFPLLSKAILTDTRFSGGRYAIKTCADKVYRQKQILCVRKRLYQLTLANRRKTIELLNAIFKQPYKETTIHCYDSYGSQHAD